MNLQTKSTSSATIVPAPVGPRYRSYEARGFRDIPQIQRWVSEALQHDIEVVSQVFPFKANNYVVDELIDWERVPDDPIFRLTFPQRGMLVPEHFSKMEAAMARHAAGELDDAALLAVANEIRAELNPHPAGQMEHNLPSLDDTALEGMQHKYAETVLFFPSQGQTCHAYCTFCFRWPQFVGQDEWKFQMRDVDLLTQYLDENPQVSDVLFTGGDPMVMAPRIIAGYLDALILAKKEGRAGNLRTIRIGSKSLSYWPYKFTTDKGADDVLAAFKRVVDAGIHLSFMAHLNHPVELSTTAVKAAVRRIRATGAVIRSQTPLLRWINDDADVWARKWRDEVALGITPYYMFVVRDTGAQHHFGVPLVEAHGIFSAAIRQVSGLARTVRGPSMSAGPGKVEVLGPATVAGERVLALRMLQARDPAHVGQPFFAKYDEGAAWLDELEPAFEPFPFED